ncbi:MAG: hypothetical protein ABFS86_07675 [Planctomycetota bacterium]
MKTLTRSMRSYGLRALALLLAVALFAACDEETPSDNPGGA